MNHGKLLSFVRSDPSLEEGRRDASVHLLQNSGSLRRYFVFLPPKSVFHLRYFNHSLSLTVLMGKVAEYTVFFNTVQPEGSMQRAAVQESSGPLVDKTCVKCQNQEMSYATLQLRSADEGQTVFYTCPKCG